MRRGFGWAGLVGAAIAAAGCASFAAGGSRNAALQKQLDEYRFPVACDVLWADAIKAVAGRGYEFVGADRELAGQSKQGFITNALNAGHSTTLDDHGVYESETDWDTARIRYQIKGLPAGKDGCFLHVTEIAQDRANMTETRIRDYNIELLVLAQVAPGDASRIEEKAEAASK